MPLVQCCSAVVLCLDRFGVGSFLLRAVSAWSSHGHEAALLSTMFMLLLLQVLSDESLRANYDAHGKEGVESAPKVDPATLFAMIFGSEKFVPLVGMMRLYGHSCFPSCCFDCDCCCYAPVNIFECSELLLHSNYI